MQNPYELDHNNYKSGEHKRKFFFDNDKPLDELNDMLKNKLQFKSKNKSQEIKTNKRKWSESLKLINENNIIKRMKLLHFS